MVVSRATYEEVRSKLLAAGYDHAVMEGGALDMHGIALAVAPSEVTVDEGAPCPADD